MPWAPSQSSSSATGVVPGVAAGDMTTIGSLPAPRGRAGAGARPARPTDDDVRGWRVRAPVPSVTKGDTRSASPYHRHYDRHLPDRRPGRRPDACRGRDPFRLHGPGRKLPGRPRRAPRRAAAHHRHPPRRRRRLHGRGRGPADRAARSLPGDACGGGRQPRHRPPHGAPGLDPADRRRRPGTARVPGSGGLPGSRPGRDLRPAVQGRRRGRRRRAPGRRDGADGLAGPLGSARPGARPAPSPAQVAAVLAALAGARSPVIVAGAGVLRSAAEAALLAFAEAAEAPVVAAWRRPDVFPNGHRLSRGMGGPSGPRTVRERLVAADVVVAVGTRLSEIATFGYAVPAPGARLVHVDLEPGFSGDRPAPDVAGRADAGVFLAAAGARAGSRPVPGGGRVGP